MNAAGLISDLRGQGAEFSVDADHIVIDAPKGLVTADLLDCLRGLKPQILRLLADQWTWADWQAFFSERAALAQHDGNLTKDRAEQQAFGDTVAEYVARNPPRPSDHDVCVYCETGIAEIGVDGIPVLAGKDGPVWLHHACHQPWIQHRRTVATQALRKMGIGAHCSDV